MSPAPDWLKKVSFKEGKDLLQKWREENLHYAEKVRDIWLYRISPGNSLGDEKWIILEQVCMAAIDLHDSQLIKDCLTALETKFPRSNRVRSLKIMANLERRGRYDEALRQYDSMIKKDPSNCFFHKRKIAILIAQRRTSDAIEQLCEYLKKFMNDTEAWLELCDLYIQEQSYLKASFCMEELILSNPHNHLYHQKYADIQYTINTPESLEFARSYYSQALNLNPNNLRALYGLTLTVSNLLASQKINQQKRKDNERLAKWAQSRIARIYQESNASQLDKVEATLASLQLQEGRLH